MRVLFYAIVFCSLMLPIAEGLKCQETAALHTDYLRRWCAGGFQSNDGKYHLTFVEWHEKEGGAHFEMLNTYQFDVKNGARTLIDSRQKDGWIYGVLFQKTNTGWLRLINEFPNMVEKPTVFIEEYNSQGNLQSTVNIDFPQMAAVQGDTGVNLKSFIKTSKNTFLLAGSSIFDANNEFISEFDEFGNQLRYVRRNGQGGFPTIIFEGEDGIFGYVKRYHLDHIVILTPDLGIDTFYSDTLSKLPVQNRFHFKDSLLFFTGIRLGNAFEHSDHEFLQIVNAYTGKIEKYIEIPFPDSSGRSNPGLRGFDEHSDFIFFSNSYGKRYCSVFGNSNDSCTNYFSVQKVSKEGVIQWSNYFGGDAAYFVNTVIATQDSGCLVIVDRRDMPNQDYHDVYYIKLDKDGNIEHDYLDGMGLFSNVLEVENSIRPTYNIFPNPSSGIITIATENLSAFDINILDINGRLVKQLAQQMPNQSIAVDDLSNGIYFLQIQSEQGTEMLKFVKY